MKQLIEKYKNDWSNHKDITEKKIDWLDALFLHNSYESDRKWKLIAFYEINLCICLIYLTLCDGFYLNNLDNSELLFFKMNNFLNNRTIVIMFLWYQWRCFCYCCHYFCLSCKTSRLKTLQKVLLLWLTINFHFRNSKEIIGCSSSNKIIHPWYLSMINMGG